MACLAGLPEKRLVTLSKKDMTEQLMFAELNLNKPCDFWDMTFGQTRPKSSSNTSYQLSSAVVEGCEDFGLFCSQRTSAAVIESTMNYSIATKYSRVEYEAICLTAKA